MTSAESHFHDIARRHLAAYGLEAGTLEPVNAEQATAFKLHAEGKNYFLKFVEAQETTVRQVRDRHAFMRHLAGSGIGVVLPVAAASGETYSHLDGASPSVGVLFPWIEGPTLRKARTPELLANAGEMLARLHLASLQYTPTTPPLCQHWDDVYCGREWLDDFLATSNFDDNAKTDLRRAASQAAAWKKPRGEYGLIHADFNLTNLICADGIRVLDFDDFGWGHFLFDLTWAEILAAKHSQETMEFWEPFSRGYQRVRPFSDHERAQLSTARLAAAVAAIEMVHSESTELDASLMQAWYDFAFNRLRRPRG